MIYFSEIKNRPVVTEDGVKIGTLDDLIFLLAENPKITKLVIYDKEKRQQIISINHLIKINQPILIEKNYTLSELEANELFVLKNILDKQIIDIKGNKIVRVNDVVIQDKPELYLAGVDVGILGILRWFKLEKSIANLLNLFKIKLNSHYLSWADIQPLELARGEVKLRKTEEKLDNIRPEDLADYLERTNINNIKKFLKILDEKQAAEVISKLHLNYQSALFKQFKPEKSAAILSLIDADEAVDILLTLSPKKRGEILNLIPLKKRVDINHLLKFSHTTIGDVMTTEFLTVTPQDSAKEVILKIKKETTDFYTLPAIYVVNQNNQLIGVFSLHELLLQSDDEYVYKFMNQHVIVIHPTTPKEIVLKKMIKYQLYCLPVIDHQKKIVGVVNIEDVLQE